MRTKNVGGIAMATFVIMMSLQHPAGAEVPVNQRVSVVFVGANHGIAVAEGVINAVGTAVEDTQLHPDGTFEGTLTFHFPDGTIISGYEGQIDELSVNPHSCRGRFTTSGSFQVIEGTGAYQDLTGGGTFSERGTFNAGPASPGGACSQDHVVRTLLITDAAGSVSLAA